MIPNRVRISPDLSIQPFRDPPIQFKLARDYSLREISFANEIRNDVNFTYRFRIEQEERVSQARFFFPKRALDIRKNLPTPNLRRMRQRRRAGIWIQS